MTQRTKYIIAKRYNIAIAIISVICAIVISIIGPIVNASIIFSILLILVGYFHMKTYENYREIEALLHDEIMLESFLAKMINAKKKGKTEIQLDKELQEFINKIGKENFMKIFSKYVDEE